ncbi:hypothetical protein RJ640_005418, partial [Escallonia rubra]
KPHAVCVPYPVQGHINPMLKLAKLLHSKGFHITFVNTEFVHQRLLKSRGPDSLNSLSSFRFEVIPDGIPPSDSDNDALPDGLTICDSTSKHCLAPFRDLLFKLNNSSNMLPLTCIVSDSVVDFTRTAAEEFGLPDVVFWTASACSLLASAQYPSLVQRGLIPLRETQFHDSRINPSFPNSQSQQRNPSSLNPDPVPCSGRRRPLQSSVDSAAAPVVAAAAVVAAPGQLKKK